MPKQKNVLREFELEKRKRNLQKQNKKNPANKKARKVRNNNWKQQYQNYDNFAFEDDQFEKYQKSNKSIKKVSNQNQIKKESNDLSTELVEGKVIEVTGNQVSVRVKEKTIRCHLRGSLKHGDKNFSNSIIVGDNVQIKIQGNQGVVETILPRKSYLARPYSPDKGKVTDKLQLIAANIDQLLIVAAWRQPNIWPELIDKYLIVSQRNDLKAIICVNKVDLSENPEDFINFMKPYLNLGIKVIYTSAETGRGIDDLKEIISGKTTVLAGLSGVGKSSIINSINPEFNILTNEVGQRGMVHNQGRHTTTTSTWYPLSNDSSIIDTPGIREFALQGLTKSDLSQYYPEIEKFILNCEYNDCTHEEEQGCAVLKALSEKQIPELRYKTYRKLLDRLPS